MVYIDLMFFEDFFFNYITLLSTGILLSRNFSLRKIFFSSIISAFFVFILPLNINKYLLHLLQFLQIFLVSIYSFKYNDIVYTVRNIIYLYFVNVFLGGCISLINMNFLILSENNILILLIIAPLMTYIYIKVIKHHGRYYSNYYKIDIYFDNFEIKNIVSFLDTGNTLIDPYKHRPVILIDNKICDFSKLKKIYVPYYTANCSDLMECIIPKRIYIHGIGYKDNILIGLTNNIYFDDVKCILNSKILEMGKI